MLMGRKTKIVILAGGVAVELGIISSLLYYRKLTARFAKGIIEILEVEKVLWTKVIEENPDILESPEMEQALINYQFRNLTDPRMGF